MHPASLAAFEVLMRCLSVRGPPAEACGADELVCSRREAAVVRILEQLGRPALHAKTLGFVHPVGAQALHFDSELPDDFQGALDCLRNFPL